MQERQMQREGLEHKGKESLSKEKGNKEKKGTMGGRMMNKWGRWGEKKKMLTTAEHMAYGDVFKKVNRV